ncbi:hypothetical protein IMZ48_40320 [Candidatus Bathyarchaeota archaeon]|nr:hypothetical protein [Candidatus Bathyarchaeota archaeon]
MLTHIRFPPSFFEKPDAGTRPDVEESLGIFNCDDSDRWPDEDTKSLSAQFDLHHLRHFERSSIPVPPTPHEP